VISGISKKIQAWNQTAIGS